MKVRIDIDCTPEEARRFFGLPNVEPLNETMVETMRERMEAGMAGMDPEVLLKTWMPGGVQGWEQFQKMFWSAMGDRKDGE